MRRMKRTVRIVSLILVLVMVFAVSASAAEVTKLVTNKSRYGDCKIVMKKAGETLPIAYTTKFVNNSAKPLCVFQNVDQYVLTFTPNNPDEDFMVFLLKDGEIPTGDTIKYIDQVERTDTDTNTRTFVIYPSELGKGTYYIYVSSKSGGYTNVGSMVVVDPSALSPSDYHLGNADMDVDNQVNVMDVTAALQHTVEMKFLDGDAFLACDVNGDGFVNVMDVTALLQYTVEMIVAFEPVATSTN